MKIDGFIYFYQFGFKVNQNTYNFFAKDRRFLDKDWEENDFFKNIKEQYINYYDNAISHMNTFDIPEDQKKKMIFWVKFLLDSFSPSNFPFTNPEVLKETINSSGENFIRGMANFIEDISINHNIVPPISNNNAFKLGKNLASTEGFVVFENDVFQLIQYKPLLDITKKSPILLIPAWINKYYIYDLSDQKSFVKFNLEQGRTVFVLSWVNPNSKHAYLSMDDYLEKGIRTAIDKVYEINNSLLKSANDKEHYGVNVVAMCVGGTFLLTKLAQTAELGINLPISSVTLLMTPFDFKYLEWLKFFIDKKEIKILRQQLNKKQNSKFYGTVMGERLTKMFCSLRANDLIWPNYVERYLLGRELSPIDFLYWNYDAPRIPINMLTEYVENFFINNFFVNDKNKSGETVRNGLEKIKIPFFIFGTERDHIVPWKSCYSLVNKIKNSKFVLGGAGHVVGCINPIASNKYYFYENGDQNSDYIKWLKTAKKFNGSWWNTWNEWQKNFDGNYMKSFEITEYIEKSPGKYSF